MGKLAAPPTWQPLCQLDDEWPIRHRIDQCARSIQRVDYQELDPSTTHIISFSFWAGVPLRCHELFSLQGSSSSTIRSTRVSWQDYDPGQGSLRFPA